jgi:hypothetical protein
VLLLLLLLLWLLFCGAEGGLAESSDSGTYAHRECQGTVHLHL